MADKTLQRTVEQLRSASAWKDVSATKNLVYAKKYKSLAKNAPADIQTNGLGQSVAFWRAKGKDEHKRLFEHLSGWLKTQVTQGELHLWIMADTTSSEAYRRATVEALAYLGWLKRFAEAEISGEEESQ